MFIFLHRGSNYGYAIAPLETTFYRMAQVILKDEQKIHYAYTDLKKGFPQSLPPKFQNVIAFDPTDSTKQNAALIYNYIRKNEIHTAFGFDQPVQRPIYKVMRKAGIRTLVTYWGAPMSSLNSGLKLLLKKVEVAIRRYKPDHYIFESRAMAETAIRGRGVNPRQVSVVPLGIDTEKFRPPEKKFFYAYDQLKIPYDRKIVIYSGHMEERKGVDVLIKAFCNLVNNKGRKDIHLVLVGNKNGEEQKFAKYFIRSSAENHITFGGYRSDIDRILRSCYVGVVASSGWDSFPRSSLEMNACGLPLVGTKLQGIIEQVREGENGLLCCVGDPIDLAEKLMMILGDRRLHDYMSARAREGIVCNFSIERQIDRLADVMIRVMT